MFGGFDRGNQQPVSGWFNLWEVFGETLVPLAKDVPFAKSLDFNGAIRYTDYSTSGGVNSWKAGLTWQPLDDVRFRAARSRDIRAPNVNELYLGRNQGQGNLVDDFQAPGSPNRNPIVFTVTSGNTDLKPEVADTTTYGIVFTPSFLPRLTTSIDRYSINIKDAIATLSGQLTIDQCYAGATALCGLLTRDANGVLTSVSTPYLNIGGEDTAGVDFETDYALPLNTISAAVPGDLTLRILANHVDHLTQIVPGSPNIRLAGQTGGGGGVPHWLGSVALQYTNQPFSAFPPGAIHRPGQAQQYLYGHPDRPGRKHGLLGVLYRPDAELRLRCRAQGFWGVLHHQQCLRSRPTVRPGTVLRVRNLRRRYQCVPVRCDRPDLHPRVQVQSLMKSVRLPLAENAMLNNNKVRVLSLIGAALVAHGASGAGGGDCNRACLEGIADRYLDAMVAHDPTKVTIAPGTRYTENGVELPLPDGLWRVASSAGKYRLKVSDPEQGEIGFFAKAAENGAPILVATRLKVVDHQITQIESVVAHTSDLIGGPAGQARPDVLGDAPRAQFLQALPPGSQRGRQEMIDIANTYWTGLENNSGTHPPLFADDCNRIENGSYTTNRPVAPGAEPNGGNYSCKEAFDLGYYHDDTRLRDRRYVVIDRERGLVYAAVGFDHDATTRSYTAVPARPSKSPVPSAKDLDDPRDLPDHRGARKISQVEAILLSVPYGMSPGWDTGVHVPDPSAFKDGYREVP